jgi:hypothetical protein
MSYILALLIAGATLVPQPAAAQTLAAASATHVWAPACRECHATIYAAWEKTKHANAIERLSGAEREKECVRCHVTGDAELRIDGRLANAGVQCESCHGAGRAHVEAARAGRAAEAPMKTAGEPVCLRCHNDRSPHFKGFYFKMMAPLVHKVVALGP